MALELQPHSAATQKGRRPYQEDRFFSITSTEGLFLGVADGHGGERTSNFIFEEFPSILSGAMEDFQGEPAEYQPELWLKEAFSRVNAATQSNAEGSTLSIAFIPWSGESVTVAVIGDSPVIVKRADQSIWVAPEHNVRTNREEAEAAIQRGGFILDGYLCASYHGQGLQMARALGDSELARVLSRVPDVSTQVLGAGSWVLVASDGALDPSHANEAEGIKALTEMINAGADAQAVVNRAIAIPTHDNVTAMLVRIAAKAE